MSNRKPAAQRRPPITLEPLMVSHAVAAAMLAQVGERTLDALVAERRIVARRLTRGRVGYLMRELRDFCEALPAVTPGVPDAPDGPPGG